MLVNYHDAGWLSNSPQVDFPIISTSNENPSRLPAQWNTVDIGCVGSKLF